MDYKISKRMDYILNEDKICDPQTVCQILKEELKPIINNYISLKNDIVVRFKKENNKNIFFIELDAERIKPFGYIPYWFYSLYNKGRKIYIKLEK